MDINFVRPQVVLSKVKVTSPVRQLARGDLRSYAQLTAEKDPELLMKGTQLASTSLDANGSAPTTAIRKTRAQPYQTFIELGEPLSTAEAMNIEEQSAGRGTGAVDTET